jgi:hypothetical protein
MFRIIYVKYFSLILNEVSLLHVPVYQNFLRTSSFVFIFFLLSPYLYSSSETEMEKAALA